MAARKSRRKRKGRRSRPPLRRRFLKLFLWAVLGCAAALAIFASYEILTWPDVAWLAHHNPPTTAFIERYKAREQSEGRTPHIEQTWIPYDRIAPDLKCALLVSEDINFFSNDGFDVPEMEDALGEAWKRREFPRGASTLTQQLAKNLWLSPSRNPWRKIKEALLTIQLERDLGKKRILELYLNVVEFGPGVYGAQAGAETYFGTSCDRLTRRQAAQLVAGLPAPDRWHPGTRSRAARRRTAIILRRMRKARFVWKLVENPPR